MNEEYESNHSVGEKLEDKISENSLEVREDPNKIDLNEISGSSIEKSKFHS